MAYDYANRMFDDDTSKTTDVAVATVAVVAMADDDSKMDVQPRQISETIVDSMCSSQTTTATSTTTTTTITSAAIATVAMQSSEEVNQINSALAHCTQLRTQIRGTLLYVQRLSSKYAHTDYMAVVRNLDNYRRQQQQQQKQKQSNASVAVNSPYPKVRPCRSSAVNNEIGSSSSNAQIISSTPVKRSSKMTRRRLVGRQELENGINNATSTPKRTKFAQLADAFGFGGNDDEVGTPKRSVREMANQSNTISVCKIKVQRDIEATITHLQVMQKQQLKRRQLQLEQSLYQSCCSSGGGGNLSAFGSTASLSAATPAASPRPFTPRQHQQPLHLWSNSRCMDQSNASSYGTAYDTINNTMNNSSSRFFTPPQSKLNRSSTMQFDEGKRTLERVERCYVTPLQRMHKRLIHLNASLVRTC